MYIVHQQILKVVDDWSIISTAVATLATDEEATDEEAMDEEATDEEATDEDYHILPLTGLNASLGWIGMEISECTPAMSTALSYK